MKALIGFFIVLFCFFTAAGHTAEDPTFLSPEEIRWLRQHGSELTVAPDPHYPPVEFFDENDVFRGISADYLALIQEKLDTEFKIVRLDNFQDILDKARSREIDIILSAIDTEGRRSYLDFTTPYIEIPNVIVVRQDDTRHLSVSDLEDMAGIVYQAGYTIGDILREEHGIIHALPTTDPARALRDLSTGRINAMVGNIGVISHYVRRENITNLRVAGDCNYDDVISIASRNDMPVLNDIIEKTLGQITARERNQISERWIQMEMPGFRIDKRFWIAAGGAVGLLLAMTGLFYLWNRSLKRQVSAKTMELQKSEEKYRIIAENTADVISILDLDLKFVYVSPAITRMTGYTVEEAMDNPVETILAPESLSKVVEIFEAESRLESTGQADPHRSRTVELEHYTKNGRSIWVEVVFSFLRDENGRPTGILTVGRDVTAHKEADMEREHLEEQLRHAQKMEAVGQLAGGVAHDFNNMLSVINGYAEMTLESIPPDDPLHAQVREIMKAGLRSADLVRQLLAFARKQTIAPIPLNLNKTIEGMLSMLRRLIGEDIDLLWIPGENLASVKMDPSQVDQMLANLVVNARDSNENGGKITIETQNVRFDSQYCRLHPGFMEGDFVMMAVSDDGCGMDEETRRRLFEPFFTTKPQGKGTGLGMPMVYGIVKQNKGFINIYSEVGTGTTIKLYLPRLDEKEKDTEVPKHPEPHDTPASGGETILLVEDNAQLMELAAAMLEQLGYKVLSAATPTGAIRVAGNHAGSIDILMTDVVMPEMNGKILMQHIRILRPGIRCLFMSGYTENVIAHHGVVDEDVFFLQKPFSREALADRLREVMQDPQES